MIKNFFNWRLALGTKRVTAQLSSAALQARAEDVIEQGKAVRVGIDTTRAGIQSAIEELGNEISALDDVHKGFTV